MAFDQTKYILKYRKEHYSQLSVDLPKEIKEELVAICKRDDITIKQFILDALESRKKENIKCNSHKKQSETQYQDKRIGRYIAYVFYIPYQK